MGLLFLAVAGAVWGWRSTDAGWPAVLKIALAAISVTTLNFILRSAVMGFPYPSLQAFGLVLTMSYLCIALPFGAAMFFKHRQSKAGE
ncbi:hypothetical protein [Sphingomonas sp.]|uniref:hypothetical protein n=1 Tax=Sphingomonas sp. TaxID=28214 RepID=UPI0017F88A28|nr:hypothetical protein [Sphingomonas sp.]MBA3512637.1 hypothetical protein [Sphingomonas sp.]